MKSHIENHEKFNTMLESNDWRSSASICGLIKYFESLDDGDEYYEKKDDYILYDSSKITEEDYLTFVEEFYGEKLHHKFVENNIRENNSSEEKLKEINKRLTGNTILKKLVKNVRFNGENQEEILDIINKNRREIILETFRNKDDMYKNFCNPNQLFTEKNQYCRLQGYTIDGGKKSKSTGFALDDKSFVGEDIQEFDFIPFAFNGDRESFFINSSYDIETLTTENDNLEMFLDNKEIKDSRYKFFMAIIKSADFIDYDVEVIVKNRNTTHFETLYLRQKSIDILKKIDKLQINYKTLMKFHKVSDDYYIDIFREVINCILNQLYLDNYIELLLKANNRYHQINDLIKINLLIKGRKIMDKDTKKSIIEAAISVSSKLEENKLQSYRNKLVNNIVANDKDRVSQILLQLSTYTGVFLEFADEIFEDFDKNKEMLYIFTNNLFKVSNNKNKDEIKGEN